MLSYIKFLLVTVHRKERFILLQRIKPYHFLDTAIIKFSVVHIRVPTSREHDSYFRRLTDDIAAMASVQADSLDDFLPYIMTSDTKKRLHTYEQLVGYLRCSYTSVDCRNMEKVIDGLIAWISSSNYKVISFCVFLIDTTLSLLYTHADRQGVDCGYYRLLFACYRHADKQGCCRKGFDILFTLCVCVCVCLYGTDFSADDKASGVKFCMVVHQCPGQGISHFGELCSPRCKLAIHREVK